MYICQHQGVTFLLGDCSETEADIAIKVHGFHGKCVQNCCLVSLEKMTTGDQTSVLSVLKLKCYIGSAASCSRLGPTACVTTVVTCGDSFYRLSTVYVFFWDIIRNSEVPFSS